MKTVRKTLNILLVVTVLLSAISLVTGAEALKVADYTPRFNVYKADPDDVVKDGRIGEHEYHELIVDLSEDKTPLYIIFGRGGASYEKAIDMLPTVRFFFSWDETHGFNLAVMYKPKDLIQQLDVNENGAYPEDGFMNNCALSAAISETQKGKGAIDTFYYAIAKRTDDGRYLQGWYNQLGRNGNYTATAEEDFVIEYTDDGYVTYEWSIPFEHIMDGNPDAGRVVYFTLSAMAGNALDVNYTDCYGIGLGDRSYLCVATSKTRHAEGVLSAKSVEDAEGTDPADKISALFSDTPDDAWYAEDVLRGCNTGLVSGMPDGTFRPNSSMTRAQLVTLLYRSAGSPDFIYYGMFDDIDESEWYARAVVWSARSGYVKGYGDNSFRPDEPITREQIATIFYRYSQKNGIDMTPAGAVEDYSDYGEISSYALPAMRWANGAGLINGKMSNGETRLAPREYATRAEVTAILLRYTDKLAM